MEGVWQTVGYGQVIEVSAGRARVFETTSVSCLLSEELPLIGPYGSEGAIGYGEDGAVEQTLRQTGPGRGVLREPGTVADIDLVAIPALPERCARPTPRDPLTTFDVFLATFAENYNSTVRKNVDWNAVRDRFRPLVTPSTRPKQLFDVLTQVVAPLGDNHVEIEGPRRREFEGLRPGTRSEVRGATRAIDAHLRKDLGVRVIQTWADDEIAYADLPDGRGYLRLTSFDDWDTEPDSFDARRALLAQVMNTVFTAQRVASWRGLVIDVSDNGGGDDQLGLDLAGRLTDVPYTAYTKRARIDPVDPTRYSPDHVVTVVPAARRPRYTGPVRVLTSDLSVSAAETFTQALMARTPAPTRVGTTTQGVFSDTLDRRLPNGWSFSLGNEDFVAPDGRNYEGLGIPPTIEVPMLTPDQIAKHQFPALDLPDPQA